MPELLIHLLIGLGAGVVGGLLGVGGGVIAVPALLFIQGYPMHLVIAATLFSNVVVGLSSAWQYSKQGRVHKEWVIRIVAGAIVGGIIGVWCASRLPGDVLRKAFGLFAAWAAIDIIFLSKGLDEDGQKVPKATKRAIYGIGFPMGLSAGFLGIGGGALAIPLQRKFFSIPIKIAIANSAASIPLICLISGLLAVYNFGLDPRQVGMLGLQLGIGGMVGAQASAALSSYLPGSLLRNLFAVLLVFLAYRMLF